MQAVQSFLKLLQELKLVTNPPSPEGLSARSEGVLRALAVLGLINEVAVMTKVAEHLGLRCLDLDLPENKPNLPVEVSGLLNPEMLWKHKILPIRKEGEHVVVAFANPFDQNALQYIQFALSARIQIVLAEELKILRLLQVIYFKRALTKELSRPTVGGEGPNVPAEDAAKQDISISEAHQPLVVRLCNKILTDAVQSDASDVHIEPTEFMLDVRFRIDGIMSKVMEVPKEHQSAVVSRLKLLAGMDIAEKRRPQDGRLKIQVSGESVDLRASCIPAAYGEKMVLRLLRSNLAGLSLEKLGLPPRGDAALRRVLKGAGKLFIVTGPTGSGKTTTLYTCLNHLKDGETNIITVEDPIEYRLAGINQVQINPAIDVSFAATLRAMLRQDPDIIMLGEIRDAETAEIALQAAQTGHLVLSTLHTNDAPSAILRLMKLSAEPYMLASTLAGVLAQRLVRKVCTACAVKASDEYLDSHREWTAGRELVPDTLKMSCGCDKCFNTGYRGRVGIYSFLEMTEEVSTLVHDLAPLSKIVAAARRSGYQSLSDAALALVRDGVTTLDEVIGYLEPVTQIDSYVPEGNEISVAPRATIEKQRVLLVEDDEDIRGVLTMILEREMYEVIQAPNGQEGLALVYERMPDIVLCDLMMPVMDGKEFVLKMRANRKTRDIPVVMLTAVATEENEIGLIDLGASDFVSKNSSSAVMLSRIRNVLQRGE